MGQGQRLLAWSIVRVPAELWPDEASAQPFYAVVVSSDELRAASGIVWLCPVRPRDAIVADQWHIALAQKKTKATALSWLGGAKSDEPETAELHDYVVVASLVITATQNEIAPTNYGAVDQNTQRKIASKLHSLIRA